MPFDDGAYVAGARPKARQVTRSALTHPCTKPGKPGAVRTCSGNLSMGVSIMLLLLALVPLLASDFQLREENDYFGLPESDYYYTQGIELRYLSEPVVTNGIKTRSVYGVRNVFYTPRDIAIAEPQPDDRPWAGLTAITYARWEWTRDEFVTREWLLGAVGGWSQSDNIQTWFHKVVGCQKPMGWSNQIPDEVVLNYTEEHFVKMFESGSRTGWGSDVAKVYGYSVGNAFVFAEGGAIGRAGWKVPDDYRTQPIVPTIDMGANELSAYLLAGFVGKAVLHNITLGGSLFQDGPSQDLMPAVLDAKAGFVFSVGRIFGSGMDFDLSYQMLWRSREFQKQETIESYGSITLGLGRRF